MRVRCVLLGLLVSACSLVGVERSPAWVEPDSRFICTDTYWLPAADVVAVGGLAVATGVTSREIDEDCDRGMCSSTSSIAIANLVLLAIPFAVSAVWGASKVRACRQAKEWQRVTPRPPQAGQNGAACVPVYGAEGRCDAGYCVRGRCQAEMPAARLRPFCAGPINRWRLATESQRARRLAEIPAACRALAR